MHICIAICLHVNRYIELTTHIRKYVYIYIYIYINTCMSRQLRNLDVGASPWEPLLRSLENSSWFAKLL